MRNTTRGVVARLMIEPSLDSGLVDAGGGGGGGEGALRGVCDESEANSHHIGYYLLYYYYTHCAYKDQHSLKPNLTSNQFVIAIA